MGERAASADADRGDRARKGLWVPGLANLALGVPAMLPLYLAWWLWTEYLPMDCKSTADLAKPGLTNCNYTTLDHAPVAMFFLAVTGVLLLALVLAVDVFFPLARRERQLKTWLGMAALIPVPFVICLSLA